MTTAVEPRLITAPYLIGHNNGSATPLSVPITTAPAAGDSIVIFTGGTTVTSVSDTKSNPYTVDNVSSTNRAVAFAYSIRPANLLTVSDTFSIVFATTTNVKATIIGIPGAQSVDLTPAGNGAASGTTMTAATGNLNQPNEICLGVACCGGSNLPAVSAPWSLIENYTTGPVLCSAYYLPGNTTATQTFTATISVANAYDVGVMTIIATGARAGRIRTNYGNPAKQPAISSVMQLDNAFFR